MSISRLRRASARAEKPGGTPEAAAAIYVLPATVSREALIEKGSDRRFRALVADFLTIASRMELVREHLGRRLGISGPQYSLVVAVAHLQGATGVSVGTVAQMLHVSSAFVASESGKLARRGFLLKRTNPIDRRGVLLSVAPEGRLKIDRLSTEICAVNDLFFGALDGAAFRALSSAAAALVGSSSKAVHYISSAKGTPQPALSRVG
jgi:DNA-binding MarR family transcriptional regulator